MSDNTTIEKQEYLARSLDRAVQEELGDSLERIKKYSARLKEIRTKRKAMALVMEASVDEYRDEDGASEAASTMVSGMSAYTQGTRSQTTGTQSTGIPSTVGGRLPLKKQRRVLYLLQTSDLVQGCPDPAVQGMDYRTQSTTVPHLWLHDRRSTRIELHVTPGSEFPVLTLLLFIFLFGVHGQCKTISHWNPAHIYSPAIGDVSNQFISIPITRIPPSVSIAVKELLVKIFSVGLGGNFDPSTCLLTACSVGCLAPNGCRMRNVHIS